MFFQRKTTANRLAIARKIWYTYINTFAKDFDT